MCVGPPPTLLSFSSEKSRRLDRRLPSVEIVERHRQVNSARKGTRLIPGKVEGPDDPRSESCLFHTIQVIPRTTVVPCVCESLSSQGEGNPLSVGTWTEASEMRRSPGERV